MTLQTPEPPLTFWHLPPEVRAHIFSFSLAPPQGPEIGFHHRTAYQTNELLVALRGDKTLYMEALEIFYKANTCYFTIDNYRDFRGKGRTSCIKRVRYLGIDLGYNFKEYRLGKSFFNNGTNRYNYINNFLHFLVIRDDDTFQRDYEKAIFSRKVCKIKVVPRVGDAIREPLLQTAPQIETLHFNIFHDKRGLYNVFLILQKLVPLTKNLRKVHLNLYMRKSFRDFIDEMEERGDVTRPWWYPSYEGYTKTRPHSLILQLSHLFGMKGGLDFIPVKGLDEFLCQWRWEAEKGEVLKMEDANLDLIDLECEWLHNGNAPCPAVQGVC